MRAGDGNMFELALFQYLVHFNKFMELYQSVNEAEEEEK